MKLFPTALSTLLVLGCSNTPKNLEDRPFNFPESETAAARSHLIGNWFGEKHHEDGTVQEWLVRRLADGTYFIEFQVTDPSGGQESWVEIGIWGVRMPIYFTAMRGFAESDIVVPADTDNHTLYDAYEIISLDGETFTYRSYTSGNEFTVTKVSEDFRLEVRESAEPNA